MSVAVYPIKVSRGFFKNYCYLSMHSETKEAVLIDPAWEMEKIEQQLSMHKAKLAAILLTHHHIDHTHLAEAFARKYQVPVMMSKIEIDAYGFSCHNLVPIERLETLVFGDLAVRLLLTPGHTKGALCYLIGDALFSGDTLFIEGCGICSCQGADPSEMFDSLSYLKRTLQKNTQIYPGHSFGKEPGLSFSYLIENNMYLQFANREQFIAFRMRPNQKGLMNFQ